MSIGLGLGLGLNKPIATIGAALWTPLDDLTLDELVYPFEESTITSSLGKVSKIENFRTPGTYDWIQTNGGEQPQTGLETRNGHNVLTWSDNNILDLPTPHRTGQRSYFVVFECDVTALQKALFAWSAAHYLPRMIPSNYGVIAYSASVGTPTFEVNGIATPLPWAGTADDELATGVMVALTITDYTANSLYYFGGIPGTVLSLVGALGAVVGRAGSFTAEQKTNLFTWAKIKWGIV